MKFRNILTIPIGLITIFIGACDQTKNDKIDHIDTTNKVITSLVTTANSDTLFISQTCAVIVIADSIQIEKRKKELGQDFYIGADDYVFYLNETKTYFDSLKLKTINCTGKKFLKFLYADNKQELLNLTNLDELWQVYLFDPKRKSKKVDMTIIDEEYKNYFK